MTAFAVKMIDIGNQNATGIGIAEFFNLEHFIFHVKIKETTYYKMQFVRQSSPEVSH